MRNSHNYTISISCIRKQKCSLCHTCFVATEASGRAWTANAGLCLSILHAMQIHLHLTPFEAKTWTKFLPFALPATLWDVVQGRVQAVGVITDVAVITQQETRGVRSLSAHLANNTFQTAPALTKHRLSDLQKIRAFTYVAWQKAVKKWKGRGHYTHFAIHTVRMVTLGTLCTSKQLPLRTLSKTTTHNTHVLNQTRREEKRRWDEKMK